jgi:hypothetical protein
MHVKTASLVRLYPSAWRRRYGDEMIALLEVAPVRARMRLDLVRGALDAWLHPPTPSRVPAVAALAGGGLWTVAAAGVVAQPVPPDWPGYLAEIVVLALAAAALLLVATLGCALRVGDAGGPAMRAGSALTAIGFVAWLAVLAVAAVDRADAATLAAAQTLAMIGATLVGIVLVRAGDWPIGALVVIGSVAMLVPWTPAWLVFGGAWTAIGVLLRVTWSRGGRIGREPV